MWDLGNRGVAVLISVLSGCAFVYNIWGPILLLTAALFLVLYACYSLVANDSLISPHLYLLAEYCGRAALEARANLVSIGVQLPRHAVTHWNGVSQRFRALFHAVMENRRRSSYQLSADSYPTTRRNSPRHSLIAQLSPIPRTAYRAIVNDSGAENNFHHDANDHTSYDPADFAKNTSPQMFPRKKHEAANGQFEFQSNDSSRGHKKTSTPIYVQNHTLTRGENTTYFTPDGSPWGTSISPKMRSKAGGVKTVQTVAGPLLASTRYNIDPKVYSDITSPGLTTRLTKYATEANTKLTHQPQYGTGQYPKVNLHASPVPVINAKSAKMRTPVTVRVAPPEPTRYSPPGRKKLLSNVCLVDGTSPSSVVQVLRDISLKRHASREDVASDLPKKQRTDVLFVKEFRVADELKQKRSRDESSKSEEEISPQNKSVRPAKRTKTPSCYDILNSLSSSINVASGVKRKAVDLSRSGTPDFEKHFKSLESVQTENVHALSQPGVKPSHEKHDVREKYRRNSDSMVSPNKLPETSPIKGILKSSSKTLTIGKHTEDARASYVAPSAVKTQSAEALAASKSVDLTDKLFMRAEPQRNEKLKLLVEEQGNIKAKFTTDDAEEIKKEDIVNMRKTSMKARLQSMFDAISGKASRINPDVVIQADDVTTAKPAPCPITCATLNSSTTTTNVNTTPISTSAVVPVISTTPQETKSTKHVAFTLPATDSLTISKIPVTSVKETKTEISAVTEPTSSASKPEMTAAVSTPVSSAPLIGVSTGASTPKNTSTPSLSFGKQPIKSTSSPSGASFTFGVVSSPSTPIAFTSNSLFGITTTPPSFASAALKPKMPATKTEASPLGTPSNPQQTSTNAQPGATFAFGGKTSTLTPTSSASTATFPSSLSVAASSTNTAQSAGTGMLPSAIKTSASTSFKSIASISASSAAPAPAPSNLFTFGNTGTNLQSKPESFAFDSSKSMGVFGNTMSTQSTLPANAPMNLIFTPVQSTAASVLPASTAALTTNTAPPAFGASTTSAAFTFGTTAAPAPASTNKPGFSFDPNVPSTAGTVPATSSATTTFGMTNNNGAITFGTPSTTANPQFGSTNTASIFGSTTTAPLFGTTNTQPVFGTPSTSVMTTGFGAPKTTDAPIFGSGINAPPAGSTTPNSARGFGSTTVNPTTGMAGTNPPPVFVSNSNIRSSNVARTSSNLFANVAASASNVNATTSPATFVPSNNIFGQTKPPPAFGATTGTFGSGTGALFGAQPTTAPPPAFGATNVTRTSAPTFGTASTPSTAPPAFGTTQSTPVQGFGSAPSMFASDNSPAPVFGATTSGFNSSAPAPAFGAQNPTNLGFAAASGTSNFGDNKSPFAAAATAPSSTFGAPSTSAPALGAQNSNSANTSSNIFTFGASQKPAQQSNAFMFGSGGTANNNAAPSSSAPFQFGASTSKPATGFTFNAPTTTPSINFGTTGAPTFNASAPGMFSIGSGSTAPRSRNVRTRKAR